MQLRNLFIVYFTTLSLNLNFSQVPNAYIVFPNDTNKYEFSTCETSDGFSGLCKKVSDCLLSSLKFTSADLCSFVQDVPLYCCPYRKLLHISPKEFEDLTILRPALQICERYYPSQKKYNILFTGGKRSLAQMHPHMAAIGWTNFDGEVDWNCGGSVVTIKFIITAAHCTSSRGIRPDVARTGDLNLLVTENNTYPEDFNITEIFVHPDYNASSMYHDIALLKITPDFQITLTNKPACLWTTKEVPVPELTGMGYGTIEYSGPRSNELFEGTLSLQSQEDCIRNIVPHSNVPNGIISGQFCAQDPNHVKDTCQGDSGGPLQFYNESGFSTRPVIVGITSFGQYCAGQSPGVYTRVSEYLNFLEPILMTGF